MKWIVIKEHQGHNASPIEVTKGTKVRVGKRSSEVDGWENWIYCWDLEQGTEGWVPDQLLSIEDDHGILLEDYTAKEISAKKGDIVEGIKEMNGWLWSINTSVGEQGWLPQDHLECIH